MERQIPVHGPPWFVLALAAKISGLSSLKKMPNDSDDDPISALKRGDLNIHCSRMELVQNTSHQPGRYIGNGYIRQNDDGVIEFTLYATEIPNVESVYPFIDCPL